MCNDHNKKKLSSKLNYLNSNTIKVGVDYYYSIQILFNKKLKFLFTDNKDCFMVKITTAGAIRKGDNVVLIKGR